jgi:hypothetical protein
MSAECALQDPAIVCPVKQRAPLLEFAHTIGCFLRMDLRHAPVVQKFAAAHGVAKVRAPIIAGINVGHRRCYSALGHNRVRFPEKRFANYPDARALSQRLNCSAQSCSACANDQNIVLVSFEFVVHRLMVTGE